MDGATCCLHRAPQPRFRPVKEASRDINVLPSTCAIHDPPFNIRHSASDLDISCPATLGGRLASRPPAGRLLMVLRFPGEPEGK